MAPGKLGRKPPKRAPALMLADVLTGVVPAHPERADYLAALSGWKMLGNDEYGDCVAVTLANLRRLVTHQAGREHYMTLDDVLKFYKTQNPGFPDQDDGMEVQTALEYLVKNGGPDGVKAVAFAKVDLTNEAEIDAALAIFGGLWIGFTVLAANYDEFDAHEPWDYVAGSPIEGGHSVLSGGYNGVTSGGDVTFITWAEETSFTDAARLRLWEEAWVVVWPEHFTMPPFQEGIDNLKLADAYHDLTGKSLVVPIPPGPTPGPTPTPAPTPAPKPSWWQTFIRWVLGLFR